MKYRAVVWTHEPNKASILLLSVRVFYRGNRNEARKTVKAEKGQRGRGTRAMEKGELRARDIAKATEKKASIKRATGDRRG